MKKHLPYILILTAAALPFVYHAFAYDDRGGLPDYRMGLLLVSLISFAVLLYVATRAIVSLIKAIRSRPANKRGIVESSFIMAVVALVVISSGVLDNRNRYGWNEDDLKKTVEVNIERRSLSVPVRYLDSTGKTDGNTVHLGLVALLPGFEGRTMENKGEFTSHRGMGRRIRIYLDVKDSRVPRHLGDLGDFSRDAIYLVIHKHLYGASDSQPTARVYGLDYFGERYGKELYVSPKEGDYTYYRCSRDRGENETFFPSCETEFPWREKVVMKYEFSKEYLKDWEKIDQGVSAFVNSLETRSDPGDYDNR